MGQLDRASFMYSANEQMTSEVKDALSAFDLDKTGRVSTSELVAGAKALQEVRGQNSFMRKILLIHALTMGLLLAGMFGLSMAAMELSKETKVGNTGALVTQKGDAVLVGSSEMMIVTGADGTAELRQRPSGDGRQLGDADGGLITVATPRTAALDLTDEEDAIVGEDGSRRLFYDPGQKYKVYARLNFNKVKKFFKELLRSNNENEFTLYLPGAEFNGHILRRGTLSDSAPLMFVAQLSGVRSEVVYVRCVNVRGGMRPCQVYFKKAEHQAFILDDGDALCMKHGQCSKREWLPVHWDAEGGLAVLDAGDAEGLWSEGDSSFWSWSDMGIDGVR